MLLTLADRTANLGARCVRLVAGAGWGKSSFVRVYAAIAPDSTAVVDCRGISTVTQFEVAIADAMRSLGIVTPAGPIGTMAAWATAGHPSTIVFDGLSLLLTVEHAIDYLRALLRTMPADRRVVLCSRVELPIVWSTYFAPHEIAALGAADLAIDHDELDLLFAGVDRAPGVDDRILELSQGWPIAVLLFVRLAASNRLERAFGELADHSTFGDLHAYVQAEIFDSLDEDELDALCAAVTLGGGTLEEISLALGRDAERDVDRLAGRMRYLLTKEGETFVPVPLARAAAETMQRDRVRALARGAIGRLQTAGRCLRAAEIALAIGDDERAMLALDEAAAPEPGFIPSPGYVRAALALGVDRLARTRNVFAILLGGFIEPATRWQLAELVDTRWRRLDASDGDMHLRTVLRIARAFLLRLPAQFEAARQSARGAERDAAVLEPGSPIARALYVVLATLAANFQNVEESDAAWTASGEARRASETFFASDRIECDVFNAVASADTNLIAQTYMQTVDETTLWHDALGIHLSLLANAGLRFFTTGHFPAPPPAGTIADERLRFDPALLSEGREAHPGTQQFDRALRYTSLAMIDAALRQSEADVALDLLKTSIGLTDRMGLPMPRVLARVVAAAVAGNSERIRLLDEALLLAGGALAERVEQLRMGTIDEASIFTPFLHGPAAWKKVHAGAPCRIEIMRGTVACLGEPVRLRGREHELLVALAMAGGALSRDALMDRLWPDQDESVSAGSLRSTLHRLRQQLGSVNAVIRDGSQYRLSEDIVVDIAEAEALYNALRRESGELSELNRGRLERQYEALAFGVPELYSRWPWFVSVESRLVDLRHGVGMLLARDDFNAKRFAEAIRWTEQLVEFDPLDEVAAEMLFQAIVQSSGRAEGARWLRRYRDLLAREYGMEPSFELDRAAGASA